MRTLKAQGCDALEQRVAGPPLKNVRDGGFRFRARRGAQRLHDTISFGWEMFRPASDEVVAAGMEFLQVDAQGRIVADYQFLA